MGRRKGGSSRPISAATLNESAIGARWYRLLGADTNSRALYYQFQRQVKGGYQMTATSTFPKDLDWAASRYEWARAARRWLNRHTPSTEADRLVFYGAMVELGKTSTMVSFWRRHERNDGEWEPRGWVVHTMARECERSTPAAAALAALRAAVEAQGS